MNNGDSFIPTSLYSKKTKRNIILTSIIVIGFYLWSSINTEAFITDFLFSIPKITGLVGDFFPPRWAYTNRIWPKLFETIQMAIISTTFSTVLCIPLSLLGAQNISPNKYIYNIIKFFLNVLRTIPDVILAVVFVGLFGIGAFSGIVALTIFSLGILAKLMSESIESIDMNPLEAIKASGASHIQTIWFAVIPQILPQFVSYVLYVFEINIRASVVLGYVGAGGIGLLLNEQINFLNYPNVMTIIIIVFIVVIVLDYISNKIREGIV